MCPRLVVLPLLEPEGLQHPLRQPAHAEEAAADDADHVVVLGVEGHLKVEGKNGA